MGDILICQAFNSEADEQNWIAEQVAKDLELGFKPDDIIITALSGNDERKYMDSLKAALARVNIDSFIVGVDGNPNIFRMSGNVTISNIFRTKGNEAWKVYACRFHYVSQPLSWKQESELQKRNEAFVALTRAKVWCVVTGLDDPIFDELAQVSATIPHMTFPAFNKALLSRVTEDLGLD